MLHMSNKNDKKTWRLSNYLITLKTNSKHRSSQDFWTNYRIKCQEINAFYLL